MPSPAFPQVLVFAGLATRSAPIRARSVRRSGNFLRAVRRRVPHQRRRERGRCAQDGRGVAASLARRAARLRPAGEPVQEPRGGRFPVTGPQFSLWSEAAHDSSPCAVDSPDRPLDTPGRIPTERADARPIERPAWLTFAQAGERLAFHRKPFVIAPVDQGGGQCPRNDGRTLVLVPMVLRSCARSERSSKRPIALWIALPIMPRRSLVRTPVQTGRRPTAARPSNARMRQNKRTDAAVALADRTLAQLAEANTRADRAEHAIAGERARADRAEAGQGRRACPRRRTAGPSR